MLYPHVLSSLILWLLKLVWYLTRVGKNSHMKYGLYSFKYNLSFNFFYAYFLVRNDTVSNGCIYLDVLWTICIHFLFLHYLLTLPFTPGYYSILADSGNLTFFHRIPPHGYLKLSGAPNFSMSAVPIDLFRTHGWKSSDHYCHCNRPTSSLSNVFLYKQLIPHRPLLHLC